MQLLAKDQIETALIPRLSERQKSMDELSVDFCMRMNTLGYVTEIATGHVLNIRKEDE